MFASPASRTATLIDGSSESLAATVNPAVYGFKIGVQRLPYETTESTAHTPPPDVRNLAKLHSLEMERKAISLTCDHIIEALVRNVRYYRGHVLLCGRLKVEEKDTTVTQMSPK